MSKAELKLNQKHEKLLKEAHYLIYDCQMPIKQAAKRLKIRYQRLLKIINEGIIDPSIAFAKKRSKPKFAKFHQRAQDQMKKIIATSDTPVQIREIKNIIQREQKLRLSNCMIFRFIKSELNVSYRKLRPVAYQYNNQSSKLQRQYAAAHFIHLMKSSIRILNVDESIITLTENRKRGWLMKGIQNKATIPYRVGQLSVVAGISNLGDLFYTINRGKNNSDTFLAFIMKVCKHLDFVNQHWRDNTIIMVDNAGYHRSQYIQNKLKELKVPLIQSVKLYMKELAMHISRMNRDWIPGSFYHVLTAALQDLALTNL